MRFVSVMGSPHGMKGNTGLLLNETLAAVRKTGAEVQEFSLSDMEIEVCRACDVCHRTGECPRKDDFGTIKRAMEDSDGLILASPNYIFSVSAQMKALLDRCCGPLHCNIMRGKYAIAVVTSGGYESAEVEHYLLRFLRAMGCWSVGSVGTALPQLMNEEERARILEVARELGARLVEATKNHEVFPEQKDERDAFFERMRTLVTMNKDRWPYEYEYWQARA